MFGSLASLVPQPPLRTRDLKTREIPPEQGEPILPGTRVGALPEDADCSVSGGLPASDANPNQWDPEAIQAALSGFELVAQLGEGAFGRVYLARQGDLSGRLVALKISSEAVGEARVLAQLLHTNIVPVYSIHRLGCCQAVCMPYLGATTLAHVLREMRQNGPPSSGDYLVSTLQGHSAVFAGTLRSRPDAGPAASPGPLTGTIPIQEPGTRAVLDRLRTMTYVEAALWMAEQLADGLAHAHERGILHRDLKPANVLLTDEGQPMLLDFNLAEDTKVSAAERARLGGTLPYMAPEQLRGLAEQRGESSVQSDLYALGVILYEMLTGRFPFPSWNGATREVVEKLLGSRSAPPPPLCRYNPQLTPAVESIVHRCLAPDPAGRYRSARELQEDISRHRENLPLKFARERSWAERARKFMRRYPRLTSASTAAALGSVVLLGVGAAAVSYRYNAIRLEAERAVDRFAEDANKIYFFTADGGRDGVADAAHHGETVLAEYGVLTNPQWRDDAAVSYLPTAKRALLEETVGGLFLVLARSEAQRASAAPAGVECHNHLLRALALNTRAEENGAREYLPRAFLTQRADLLAKLGNEAEATAVLEQAHQRSVQSERDACMTARDLIIRGRFPEAEALLLEATREAPKDAVAWFLLAGCREALGRDGEAVADYIRVTALRPETAPAYFHLGLNYLRQGKYRESVENFTQALERGGDNADTCMNRALALKALGRYRDAIQDLDRALELNSSYTRIFFIRARLYEALGDRAAAERDREEGLKRTPSDEQGWVTRGAARMATDPDGALEDFKKALEINPRSTAAFVNVVHVLADRLGRTEDALPWMERAIDACPSSLQMRLTRGLLHARLGNRAAALADAKLVMAGKAEPSCIFLAGAIYAQTSRLAPADRTVAVRLLTMALQKGYGHDLLERNIDLAPLRGTPEFTNLVNAFAPLR